MITDRTQRASGNVLLHRQACFLAGFDPTGIAPNRLTSAKRAYGQFARSHGWSTHWSDARSMAASIALQGDPELLQDFIARAHPDDTCERAGLNYWAYWVGEMDQRQRDDLFMPEGRLHWRGTRLMRHLVDRLDSDHPFVDLNVHSVWALLGARHGLAHDDPATTRDLVARTERLMDEGRISRQSGRELASVLYALRMEGFTGKAGV